MTIDEVRLGRKNKNENKPKRSNVSKVRRCRRLNKNSCAVRFANDLRVARLEDSLDDKLNSL